MKPLKRTCPSHPEQRSKTRRKNAETPRKAEVRTLQCEIQKTTPCQRSFGTLMQEADGVLKKKNPNDSITGQQ